MKTNQDKLRDAIGEIVGDEFDSVASGTNPQGIDKLLALFENSYKEREKELLQDLLDNGHGGGNFRRLIIQKLQALERTK